MGARASAKTGIADENGRAVRAASTGSDATPGEGDGAWMTPRVIGRGRAGRGAAAAARIESRGHGLGREVVTVTGVLDRAAVARLRIELAAWRAAGVRWPRVDLSPASGGGPGLPRMLAWAAHQLRGQGGQLSVHGGGHALRAEPARAQAVFASLPGWHRERPPEWI